jgi:hypothetical protein
MATDIVGGLFGITPEMYQQQMAQQGLQEGASLGQMSPDAFGRSMLYAGGAQLGRGLGGALGAEDPQLKLISLRNAVMREVNLNDPNSIMMGAQKLGQFDAQGASALANLAREAIAKNAESTQKFASATKSMAETGEITSKRDLLNSRVQALIDSGTPENLAKGIASNDKAFADFVAAKNISTPPEYAIQARALGYEAKPFLKDYTQEQVQAMEKGVFAHKAGIAKAGASATHLDLGSALEKVFLVKDREEAAKNWATAGQAYTALTPTLGKLDKFESVIPTGFTGAGADAKLALSKGLAAFGVPISNRATDTEFANAISSQLVQQIAKVFPGSQSNKELEQLLKSKPNMAQEAPTIARLINEIRNEIMSKKVTYEQMAKLPEKDRTSFNPNIAEGQNYLKVQEYNDLVQKYKSGKISDAERAKAKSLQTELGL